MTARILFSLAALLATPAFAATGCDSDDHPATFVARADNDVWGGAHQDQGYTAGGHLTWVSATRGSADGDPCASAPARFASAAFGWLQADGEANNVLFSFDEAIYTPTDKNRSDVIPDDRPYVGIASFDFGWNSRRGDRLATTRLRLGIAGPSARGEQMQNAIHHLFGRGRFLGWDNQLRDEPVVQLTHERIWQWQDASDHDGWGFDHSLHAGGALGNADTHANFGGELRFGWKLPDDVVSSPLRPGGDGIAPALHPRSRDWAWHIYASLDNRLVARDITLDGSTWKDSHSVDRKAFVADLTLGFVLTHGAWRFAATHTRRTHEFEGQAEAPVFGTFSLAREF